MSTSRMTRIPGCSTIFNFRVQRGEVIALVGSSGGRGKTTPGLILLPRFYEPTSGCHPESMGVDISSITIRSLREQIAHGRSGKYSFP